MQTPYDLSNRVLSHHSRGVEQKAAKPSALMVFCFELR